MIEFFAGALSMAYLVAAVFFFRFWKKTRDRLFLHFSIAFVLFMLNQAATMALQTQGERDGYAYFLRVLGFSLILYSIWDKNVAGPRKE